MAQENTTIHCLNPSFSLLLNYLELNCCQKYQNVGTSILNI